MFLLYISDVTSAVDEKTCAIILYADDSKITGKTNTAEECNNFANNIRKLYEWSNAWQLSINVDKCESLRVGNKNPNLDYNLGENNIPSNIYTAETSAYWLEKTFITENIMKTRRNHFLCKQFLCIHLSANTRISLNSFTKHTYYPNWNMQALCGHRTTKKT